MFTKLERARLGVLALLLGLLVLVPVGSGCGMLEQDKDEVAPVDVPNPADDNENPAPVPDEGDKSGWAAEVVQVSYGPSVTFGQQDMPDIVLGPAQGAGTGKQSLHVVSLGMGGSIVLGFGSDACVLDRQGNDLVVMENPFYVSGDGSNRFIEVARVAVSQDGEEFFEFPSSVNTELPLGDPERYSGFAGVEPVLSSGAMDSMGGDRFDLAAVGIGWARYVRITDAAGSPEDPGDRMGTGSGMDGFDLDAVGALVLGTGGDCR